MRSDVAFVIPVYNEGKVVKDVIESVREHYSEVVAVNDCSTDDSAARLVEPGNVDELAREIGALLADPDERRRLSAGGRARVMERYSWAAVARRTVEVYETAIARVRGEALPDLTAGPVIGPDQAEIDEHITDDVPEVLPASGERDIREQEDAAC